MNSPGNAFTRRKFLYAAALGAVTGTQLAWGADDKPAASPGEKYFNEPPLRLPIARDADVIVCGAGPAGISAAITAARAGARTRLFEVHGCLGGVWTAGLLTYIFDFDKPGLTREIVKKLDERDARRNKNSSRFVYEPEVMKLLVEEMCVEAGVKIQLLTSVVAAYRQGQRLTTIITESKSGREAWTAPVFIDTTGDGDLGAQAGCAWEVGQAKDCPCQPMTMNALAVVEDAKALGKYTSFTATDEFTGPGGHLACVEAFKGELKRAGVETSYGHPTIFPVHDNLVMLMLNHEYGVMAYDSAKITEATLRSRAEIHRVAKALRSLGGVWKNLQIATSAEQIGVRDGRRIRGRYTVTKEDLIRGARQPDAVCRVTFGVDIHAETRESNSAETISHGGFKTEPYDIPLRALIAKDVDGLMMAGRCISGDFIAHASYRVTGNAVAMGEAAGVVAAIAAKSGRLPQDVEWSEGAGQLAKMGQRI
ncbi:MAG: FAD-dependent oxidoreductase [Verrucomicrobiales bacterium]|nr:FAD-dependent oxidoreductase [Verrucomicrobiales bacterium]